MVGSLTGHSEITVEQCVEYAQANYPLIKKYELLKQTSEISLSEINTAWFPRVAVAGQATWQSAVPTFPKAYTGMMQQLGTELKGIPRWQYRTGVEVSQTVWDGGTTARRRELEKASTAVQQSSLDVDMYAVRERVESIYFGLLLVRNQIEQLENTRKRLQQVATRMKVYVQNGTALTSDANLVEAQLLTLEQQIDQARSSADGYLQILKIFIDRPIAIADLVCGTAQVPADLSPLRPELKLMDARRDLARVQQRLTDTALMPKFGLFGQGFYGNPGLDNFKSMLDREATFNFIGGVKATWNIDAFYTRNSSQRRTALAEEMIETDRATLLRNLAMQSDSQLSSINGLKKIIEKDTKIVELRSNVRDAAEAKFENGVVDSTYLLEKITDELASRLNAKYHEIQLIQEIYRLKYTLNR